MKLSVMMVGSNIFVRMESKVKKLLFSVVLALICVCNGQAQTEIPDNSADENSDGWLGTSLGFNIRAAHPRTLLTKEKLDQIIDRMYGPNARDPYKRWFELIKDREDNHQDVDLTNLALIYRATGDATYRDRFTARVPTEGDPGVSELYGLDIMFDEISDSLRYSVMRRVADNPDCWYWNSVNQSNSDNATWGYHSAHGVHRALAFAGAFAFTDVELNKDPAIYKFNASNYLSLAAEELSSEGNFWRIENRIAGDPLYNSALPGSYGGMYDNFGYDSSEESNSIFVVSEFYNLTGVDRFSGFLHDKYRAAFYQNLYYPYKYTAYTSDQWCRRAGTENHIQAIIWNTQTSWIDQPTHNAVALTAGLYQDPRMQYYFQNGRQRELCNYAYDGMYWDLIYYDDQLGTDPPSSNPTAMYFNGPGLVSMRSDWSNEAAFAVFVAGEGISRRYEDANSFIMGRKEDIFVHAGARIRNNTDNSKHHWYHIRSASKNTLKIFDPEESYDINVDGTVGPLHSGARLVLSDNLGGQIFETPPSGTDGCYSTGSGCGNSTYRSCASYPLGVCEVADVIRYEHVPGEYTYTAGDGAAAYTKKIEYYEREFLFLRPDVFVVFDRVRSVNPHYRKVWVAHTVDEPVVSGNPASTGLGLKTYENQSNTTIASSGNITYIDSLLPKENKIIVRGGDSILLSGQPLASGGSINGSQILESDIPRWLELFAVGNDVEGTVTVQGSAGEGTGVSENIVFDGTRQNYLQSKETGGSSLSSIVDTTQRWKPDQWKGYMVDYRSGSSAVITGNSENTLYGNFSADPSNYWRYIIYRPIANSYYHWQSISQISTSDMDLDYLTVSVPHYFDTEDAGGRVSSFSPHTDRRDDQYAKNKNLGQWTLNIEAAQPELLDNFLNVIILKDPGIPKAETRLIEGEGISGAVVGSSFVMFANERSPITSAGINIPANGSLQGFILNCEPETVYYYTVSGNRIEISKDNNSGASATSSQMGILKISVTTSGENNTPSKPSGLKVR
jgi:hypothetical protein